jgi:hypothetical protein
VLRHDRIHCLREIDVSPSPFCDHERSSFLPSPLTSAMAS